MVVGVPGEDFGGGADLIAEAGAVNVLYGSSAHLTAIGNQIWHDDGKGIARAVEEGDLLGFSLTTDDFNGDGYCDVVLRSPGEGFVTGQDAGSVIILLGSFSLLSAVDYEYWYQDTPGIEGLSESGDQFAWSLPVGLFRGNTSGGIGSFEQ